MEYHLYPPFFVIEPETSFDDAWEAFCCELLNLENHTNTIRRRLPPDQGCDLLWEEEKIAYQCKAVEGRSSKLNLSKVGESIQVAKKNQDILGWKSYILCTNVNLTGKTEQKIREMLPDIEFLPLGYWQKLCKKFPYVADSRCRRLVSVSQQSVSHAINKLFLHEYAKKLEGHLDTEIINLLVYSNLNKNIFELPVSPKFTAEDIIDILVEIFRLPNSREYHDLEIAFWLSHSLVINGNQIPLSKSIEELSLPKEERPLVTLWTQFIYRDEKGQFDANVIHLITPEFITLRTLSAEERVQNAIERFKQEINAIFSQTKADLKE